ncbi:MAG: hypothetical protein GXO10_02970 [Crenarchaeota archaeon]|nr:hypothetical protein [Thermoproteota archaeon]
MILKSKFITIRFKDNDGLLWPEVDWHVPDKAKFRMEELEKIIEESQNTDEERAILVMKNGARDKVISTGAAHVDFNPSRCLMDIHTHPMGGYFSGIDDGIDVLCPGHICLLATKDLPIDMRPHIGLYINDWPIVGRISLGVKGFMPLTPDEIRALILSP